MVCQCCRILFITDQLTFILVVVAADIMEIRHELEESIESHGGKVIEKMPAAV